MEIESIGIGAASGFLTAILTAFGINRRLNNVENVKQEKAVCLAVHGATDLRLQHIEDKLDDLNDYLRNHKGV